MTQLIPQTTRSQYS
ncbi:BgTH12-06551 [Blumeria graminis f. sp. triticale]|uniref:BgTH12-06551 n=1 Tax=Blumeria graminis f. sp. triticale TaxID=1689686 RepID=A0A9W4DJH1_BLUGR|nr:BgTH12-06551 [Blumeria graminis f. sp. triticale]